MSVLPKAVSKDSFEVGALENLKEQHLALTQLGMLDTLMVLMKVASKVASTVFDLVDEKVVSKG